jgi:uncharacterized protein YbjT (DUF2867 family)
MLGGSGFVGGHLAGELVRRGFAVRIPTRLRQRHRDLLVLPGVELIQADIFDEPTLSGLIRGCDAVVNLVGILNEKGHDGRGFRRAHVELVEKLIGACQETGVSRLLHMSALKANADRGPSHYLQTKGRAEQLIKNAGGDDVNYTIFRPAAIFGAGDSFTNRFAGLLQWLPVLPLAQPNARFAPVYVGDVVEAFARALEDPSTYGRSFELCGPEIYSLREIVEFVRRQRRLKRVLWSLPPLLAKIQAWTGDYLIPGKPFSLDNLRSLSVANVCTENGLQALGIRAHRMSSVAPTYLARPDAQTTRMRQTAGR